MFGITFFDSRNSRIMTITEQYAKLKSSYTHHHLHTITTKIIDLYKNKQNGLIDKIMAVVNEYTKEPKETQGKAFYKLMMIYHPDRISFYQTELEKHFLAKNKEALQRYAHIIPVLDLERALLSKIQPLIEGREPEEYGWDASPEEFSDIDEESEREQETFDEIEEPAKGRSFFITFKQQVYGTKNIELPFYYLEELDSLDLSGYEINDLDGLVHCKNLLILDLSNNFIEDVAEISALSHLHELYLANNHIGYIDALNFCTHLKIVDLSFNKIDDLSPLFDLEELEYVNVAGNPMPAAHIAKLKERNIMVIW